jgi:hypothetical protein
MNKNQINHNMCIYVINGHTVTLAKIVAGPSQISVISSVLYYLYFIYSLKMSDFDTDNLLLVLQDLYRLITWVYQEGSGGMWLL